MMVAMARAVICLSLCILVCQVKGLHVPAEMNRTVQKLLQHYNISTKERFNGMPVFKNIPQGKTETQMLYLGAVLETYEKLIDHMLKQLPTPSPQTASSVNGTPNDAAALAASKGSEPNENIKKMLNIILKNIHDLKLHRYREQGELLKRLQELQDIKMNDPVVQSKALFELLPLYDAAGSLSDRRRRRRQAKSKNRPRF